MTASGLIGPANSRVTKVEAACVECNLESWGLWRFRRHCQTKDGLGLTSFVIDYVGWAVMEPIYMYDARSTRLFYTGGGYSIGRKKRGNEATYHTQIH